jgi:hypothetical protein
MIKLITYSDERMTKSAYVCARSAVMNNCDESQIWIPEQIKDWGLRDRLKKLGERGAGYWLWKPHIIAIELITNLNDGDILIYADAGVEVINNVRHIIDRMDEDFFFFSNGHRQVEWCKMDAFVVSEVEPNFEDRQVQASVIFMKKTPKVLHFIGEWLNLCEVPGLIDDSPSLAPNWPTFREHRHDQALLTCMQIKHGYKLHWWPAHYCDHIRDGYHADTYPVMFNHHRKRDNEWN